jgi:hypothetical protein
LAIPDEDIEGRRTRRRLPGEQTERLEPEGEEKRLRSDRPEPRRLLTVGSGSVAVVLVL